MCSGSSAGGDVVSGPFRIAEDRDFEGSVTMLQNPPDVDIFSVASDEFKQALLIKSDLPH